MHLCLELGHIQREIFEHVYEPPAWSWVEACFADRRNKLSSRSNSSFFDFEVGWRCKEFKQSLGGRCPVIDS